MVRLPGVAVQDQVHGRKMPTQPWIIYAKPYFI